MSLFARMVVKAELRMQRDSDGTRPPDEITAEFAAKWWRAVAISILVLIVAGILTREFYGLTNGNLGPTLVWFALLSAVIGYKLYERTERLVREAAQAREKVRAEAKRRADAETRRQLAVVTRTNELKALAEAERHRKAAEVLTYRLQLLALMEADLRELFLRLRKRVEWVPERVDEEHINELIRRALRQADVPELGILRRSVKSNVIMILGDRSCLPPDPSDAMLVHRRMPSLLQLFDATA